MIIKNETIRQLRETTGASIMEIKRALEQTQGDLAKAVDVLRRQGKKIAHQKAGRTAREGIVGSYVHANGKVAALVSVACETDFVARNADFQELAHDLALHIAAMAPAYRSPEDVPTEIVEHEREIARDQMADQKKPAAVMEKIVQGKLEKFYAEHCLSEQPFVKDDSLTIGDLLEQAMAKLGEKIEVREFIRLHL